MKAAAEILDEHLANYEWKYYRFEEVNVLDYEWKYYRSEDIDALDGTSTGEDRDQRFKTVCINVKSNNNDENQMETLKATLLTCWKAMDDARISFNYQTAAGDKPICVKTNEGDAPTPFSYTFNKSHTQRHKALHATDYNPLQLDDPFKELFFSIDDLDDYDIGYHPLANAVLSFREEVKHSGAAQKKINDDLERCINDSIPKDENEISADFIIDMIEAIKEEYSKYQKAMQDAEGELNDEEKKRLKEKLARDFRDFIKKVDCCAICKFPRDAQSRNLSGYQEWRILYSTGFRNATLTTENVDKCLDLVKNKSIQELAHIQEDYHNAKSTYSSNIFSENKKEEVANLIQVNPAMAQRLYRRQTHLQHEVTDGKELKVFIGKRLGTIALPKVINFEIARLTKASWNPFKRSALIERKREALIMLRNEFSKEDNKGKTVKDVIDNWLIAESFKYKNNNISNATLISYRSNSFFTKKIDTALPGETQEKTETLQFIEDTKRKWGSFKI